MKPEEKKKKTTHFHTKRNMQHFSTGGGSQLVRMLVIAAALLVLTTTSSSSPNPPLRQASFDHLTPNDVLFTEDVLQNVSARSRIECSKKCVETEGCVMCTFRSSPQGPSPGLCHLHSQLQTGSDAKKSVPGAKSMALRQSCAEGYVMACDRCLKVVKTTVTHTTAKQQCSQMKGQLVMIKTSAEANCIWSILIQNGLEWVWLGADDSQVARTFRWTDGTLLPSNSPLWDSNEPDSSYPGADCVNIRPSSTGLQDSKCVAYCHFMCQMDIMT